MYTDPLQLLIATRLAAQCTDLRVNMVTPALFDRFKTVDDFAQADITEVEEYIKSCGLYKTKAKDIVNMCIMLRDRFGGKVPDTIEQLTTLPGVGRKTANLMIGDIFKKPAVVVDTHCIRITGRLGFHTIRMRQRSKRYCGIFCRRRNLTISATALCCMEGQFATPESRNATFAA